MILFKLMFQHNFLTKIKYHNLINVKLDHHVSPAVTVSMSSCISFNSLKLNHKETQLGLIRKREEERRYNKLQNKEALYKVTVSK